MQTGRKLLTTTSLGIAVVLLFAVNMFSAASFKTARVDLTESKLFTLTQGTRNILDQLEDPITLRLFLSQKEATRLPGINSYAQRVRELLEQYARIAEGKIRLSFIDPEPFSEEEDRAVAYGLRGIGLEGDAVFYFGMVGTNSVDDQEVIPFFSPNREEFVEHDVTKVVYQLANPKRRIIGILSSLPVDGGMGMPPRGMTAPWAVMEQVRQLFEVTTLEPDTASIPEDIDVVMIVHPKGLSELTLYAVDQFVLRGGRALIFVDPHSESDQPGRAPMLSGASGSSDLAKLFEPWGLRLAEGKVAGDLRVAEQVRYSDNDGRAVVAEYPLWMSLPPTQFNSEDVVTAELGNLVFATPGILETEERDGLRVTPLVETTPDAMAIDSAQLRFLNDPTMLLRQYQAGGQKLVLAARVSGKAITAFPEGKPVVGEEQKDVGEAETESGEGKGGEEDVPHRSESQADINVIVVADTDLLNDRFWVRVQNFLGNRILIPSAANGNFVINALESLLGSNDLISVRSRGRYSRPFTKVAEIQQQAELEFRQKEQELLNRLRDTENKLLELEDRKQGDDGVILNAEQQQEIEKFRLEKIRIRKELRSVRHQLHRNIESLDSRMKFLNIGLMPLLIGTGGVFIGLQRMRRRRDTHARKAES